MPRCYSRGLAKVLNFMSKDVLKKVNEVYSEQNPSTYFDDEVWLPRFVKNLEKFVLKLKLPPRAFLGSSLVDFGCGTGQKSLAYDNLGASCTLIEYDKKSFEMAEYYFSNYAKNPYRLINSNLFDAKVESAAYDFVLSSGVAHHTSDPELNLALCCDALKPRGFLIFGIANKAGFFQRNLQRLIVYSVSENKEDIIKFSKLFFDESLQRSVKYGGRTLEAVIWDTFLNPKIYCFGTQQIMSCFASKGLQLYSSFRDLKEAETTLHPSEKYHRNMDDPNISSGTDLSKEQIYISDFEELTKSNNSRFNGNAVKKLDQLMQYFDAINDLSFNNFEINIDSFLQNAEGYSNTIQSMDPVEIIDKKYNSEFFKEVHYVVSILNKKTTKDVKVEELSSAIENSKHLFRKFNGVGMNYYCGYKNKTP